MWDTFLNHPVDTLLFGRSLSETQGISIAHHLQTFIAHSRRLNNNGSLGQTVGVLPYHANERLTQLAILECFHTSIIIIYDIDLCTPGLSAEKSA